MINKFILINKKSEISKAFADSFSKVFSSMEYVVVDVSDFTQKINNGNVHVNSFLERLKNCFSVENLCDTCNDFARKFDFKTMNFVLCDELSDLSKLICNFNEGNSYFIPCYVDSELFGFFRIIAVEPDIPFIVFLTNAVALTLRYLKLVSTEYSDKSEVHETQPCVRKVITSNIPPSVTKFIPSELVCNCDVKEVKKSCLSGSPGIVLLGDGPMCDCDDVFDLVEDLREMYSTSDLDVFFFKEFLSKAEYVKVGALDKMIVLHPCVLNSIKFQSNLRSFLSVRNKNFRHVYSSLNEAFRIIGNNLSVKLQNQALYVKLGITQATLNRYSLSFIGMSLKEYQALIRIHNALLLIDIGKKNLQEISEFCGFDCYLTFQKTFEEIVHCKPSEYSKAKN